MAKTIKLINESDYIENYDVHTIISNLDKKSLPEIEDAISKYLVNEKVKLLKNKVYEINEVAAQFYHENLYKPTSKIAQDYVKKRKLDNKTLKAFTIGYSCKYNELYQI